MLEEILGNRDHKQHLWDIVEAIREGEEKKKESLAEIFKKKNSEQGDEEEDRRIINQRSLATCFSDHFFFLFLYL